MKKIMLTLLTLFQISKANQQNLENLYANLTKLGLKNLIAEINQNLKKEETITFKATHPHNILDTPVMLLIGITTSDKQFVSADAIIINTENFDHMEKAKKSNNVVIQKTVKNAAFTIDLTKPINFESNSEQKTAAKPFSLRNIITGLSIGCIGSYCLYKVTK